MTLKGTEAGCAAERGLNRGAEEENVEAMKVQGYSDGVVEVQVGDDDA